MSFEATGLKQPSATSCIRRESRAPVHWSTSASSMDSWKRGELGSHGTPICLDKAGTRPGNAYASAVGRPSAWVCAVKAGKSGRFRLDRVMDVVGFPYLFPVRWRKELVVYRSSGARNDWRHAQYAHCRRRASFKDDSPCPFPAFPIFPRPARRSRGARRRRRGRRGPLPQCPSQHAHADARIRGVEAGCGPSSP